MSLFLKCYPKSLIRKVQSSIDVLKSLKWEEAEWAEFFLKV